MEVKICCGDENNLCPLKNADVADLFIYLFCLKPG
jgi:hypothetical protein